MNKLLSFCLLILFIAIGCRNNGSDNLVEINFDEDIDIGDIDNFKNKFSPPLEVFQIDAAIGGRIITARNSVITFSPSSFEYLDGSVVTGDVEIQVVELLTKSEILLHGIHTWCDDRLLESAGEFRIQVFQKGNELKLKDGANYNLFVANNNPRPKAELFYGDEESREWIEADQDDNTQENVLEAEVLASEAIGWLYGYESFPDRLGWINVDWFVNDPSAGLLKVELPPRYGLDNTIVYAHFLDLNAVLELWFDTNLNRYFLKAPIGYRVEVFSITNFGGDNYKFATQEVVIQDDEDILLNPVVKSFDEIEDFIEALGD